MRLTMHAEAQCREVLCLRLSFRQKDGASAAVNFSDDGADLIFNAKLILIAEAKAGVILLAEANDRLGKLFSALAAVRPHVREDNARVKLRALFLDELKLCLGIRREAV